MTPASRALRDRLLITASLVWALIAAIQVLDFGYGRDQGIFETVASAIRHGGVPYRDVWDFKPPGIYFVYALADTLFGQHVYSIRVIEIAGLLSLIPAFALLSRRFVDDVRPGLLGAAFAIVTCAEMEFWHTGQPESFGAILIAWALVASTAAVDIETTSARRARLLWFACGICSGLATLLKPTIGIGGAASVGFALMSGPRLQWHDRRTGRAGLPRAATIVAGPVLLGTLLPLAACAWYFASRGALADLIDAVFVFAPRYTALAWDRHSLGELLYLVGANWLFNYSAINAAGLVLLMLLAPWSSGRLREGATHIAIVLFALAFGVIAQARVFLYHLGSVLPLTALLAGWGFWQLWLRTRDRWTGVIVFTALVGTLAFWFGASRLHDGFFARSMMRAREWTEPDNRQTLRDYLYSIDEYQASDNRLAADWIRQQTSPRSTMLVYGFTPELYVTAGRAPASRYIYNVPQRTAWSSAKTRAELIADMRRSIPEVIVVERRDFVLGVTGVMVDSVFDLYQFTELRTLVASQYSKAATFGRLDVYRRLD